MEETFRKNILDRIEKAEKEVEAAKELPGYGEAYWQGVIEGLEQAYRLAAELS